MTFTVPIVAVLLASSGQVSTAQAVWTRSYSKAVTASVPAPVSAGISENGRCSAIAAAGGLEVVDRDGHTLWRWEYGRSNRFIRPGAIAVSPGCDAIVLVGDDRYRYTWFVNQAGRARSVRTANTPKSATWNHDGRLVAVGTGGGEVFLFTRTGQLKMKATPRQGVPVGRLSFSADNAHVLVQGVYSIAVLRLDGTVVWSRFANGMNASRDLRTFVSWWEPPHGPGIGHVSVLDQSGNVLWERFASWTGAVVSPDGERIVARINDNQQPAEEDGFHALEQKTSLQVVSRAGQVVTRLDAAEGEPIAISPDGKRVLIRSYGQERAELVELDMTGSRLSQIPLTDGVRDVLVASDFTAVVVVLQGPNGMQVRQYILK